MSNLFGNHIVGFPTRRLKLSYITSHCLEPSTERRSNEPRHEKTNNVVSEQFRHKPGCTSTEDGQRPEYGYLSFTESM